MKLKKVTCCSQLPVRLVKSLTEKDQDRLQDELEFTCEACADVDHTSIKLNGAFREVSNCRATDEATCAEVKKASQRTADLKRKAAVAQKQL